MKTLCFARHPLPDADHHPLIKTVPRKAPGFFVRAQYFTHLIVTSKTVAPLLPHTDAEIISVGIATTKHLEEAGFSAHTVESPSQEGVLEYLNRLDLSDAYIGIPTSPLARPLLSKTLSLRGIRHYVGHLYDTIPTEEPLPDLEAYHRLVFSSGSTVDAFFAKGGVISSTHEVIVQGKPTADRLASYMICKNISYMV